MIPEKDFPGAVRLTPSEESQLFASMFLMARI
jgi:hypothetical protein